MKMVNDLTAAEIAKIKALPDSVKAKIRADWHAEDVARAQKQEAEQLALIQKQQAEKAEALAIARKNVEASIETLKSLDTAGAQAYILAIIRR